MTSNVYDPRKHQAYVASRPQRPTTRDHVAPAMVRGWDSEQRKRIRGILLTLLLGYPQDQDLLATPEIGVVAMIDQEG